MLSSRQQAAMRARRRKMPAWPVLLSLALHLALFLGLLLFPPQRPSANGSEPLSVDLIAEESADAAAPGASAGGKRRSERAGCTGSATRGTATAPPSVPPVQQAEEPPPPPPASPLPTPHPLHRTCPRLRLSKGSYRQRRRHHRPCRYHCRCRRCNRRQLRPSRPPQKTEAERAVAREGGSPARRRGSRRHGRWQPMMQPRELLPAALWPTRQVRRCAGDPKAKCRGPRGGSEQWCRLAREAEAMVGSALLLSAGGVADQRGRQCKGAHHHQP